jgi:hypothetical protein
VLAKATGKPILNYHFKLNSSVIIMIDKKNLKLYHLRENGQVIEWTWSCRPYKKIFWKTWKPVLENVKILSNIKDKDEHKLIQQEVYEEVMNKEFPKKVKQRKTIWN